MEGKMLNWQQLQERIVREIQPNHQGILKCKGDERRAILSNNGDKIVIRTGVETTATKNISFEMIHFAFDKLMKREDFDSAYYRTRFEKEYKDGQCRYSIVGGILIEMDIAERHPKGKNSCVYRLRA
jgi:hypothetical protein